MTGAFARRPTKTGVLELLQQKKVATVMGSAFSAPGYARASFAASMETLKTAFDRIEEFVAGK